MCNKTVTTSKEVLKKTKNSYWWDGVEFRVWQTETKTTAHLTNHRTVISPRLRWCVNNIFLIFFSASEKYPLAQITTLTSYWIDLSRALSSVWDIWSRTCVKTSHGWCGFALEKQWFIFINVHSLLSCRLTQTFSELYLHRTTQTSIQKKMIPP